MDEKKSVRCITITTDASFHHGHKVGGHAFIIVCDLFRIKKTGSFKDKLDSSNDGELKCIINALHTLLIQEELPTTTHLVINTDSTHCINAINTPNTPLGYSAESYYKKVIEKTKAVNYSVRHVKAHVKGQRTKREGANEWCDQQAKKYMRLAVENKVNKKK